MLDSRLAARDFDPFHAWCAENQVWLACCRLGQTCLAEAAFLHAHGFRFVELNYKPVRRDLGDFTADPDISVGPATREEAPALIAMASRIFTTGRLHQDPFVGPKIGNARYAGWVARAFETPTQEVMSFREHGRPVGFMVVESPAPDRRVWSLGGLAPGMVERKPGRGRGNRAWRALLASHAAEGVVEVIAGVSSLNVPSFNLFAALGFRLPPPEITLHWGPPAPSDAPAGR